jgi:hypothetical protein
MRRNSLILLCTLAAVALVGTTAVAQPSAQDIAKLGTTLTPLGGEKAGNADGSIPAWDGGLTKAPAGWKPGTHYANPFAGESPLFTIPAQNAAQYAAKLSEGHKAMLKAYPSFRIHVYTTHRTAAAPQRIYDATKKIAATAKLAEGGNGVSGAVAGIPFPMPKSGVEVIWNHLLRYRAEIASRTVAQAAPTRGGQYTLVQFEEETMFVYHLPGTTEASMKNRLLNFKQAVVAPARLAGGILLVHESMNQIQQPRDFHGVEIEHRKEMAPREREGPAEDLVQTGGQGCH